MANISLFNAVVGYQLNASVYVNTNSSGVAPSGTVTFFANGTPMIGPVTYTPYNGGPNRGSASLNASISTTTSPFPAPGTYTITASYSGDANYTASTAPGQTINVKFPQPGLSLQSSGYTVAPGTTLTFTATVFSTSPTIAPTGTLTISSGTYGQLPGTPTYKTFVDQNGNMDLEATLTYTISVSDNFTVAYSGDSNYPNAFTGSGLITVTGSDFNLTFTQTTLNVVPGQGAGVNLIVGDAVRRRSSDL
jgi:plastocyanin